MKTLKESILSDIDATLSDKNTNAQIRRIISKFLKDNFKGRCTISNKPNSDGLFEVSSKYNISTVKSNITKLTNDLFIWTNIERNFECVSCPSLMSLKGGPKHVGGKYSCINCPITSLEGAPVEVGGDFNCSYCGNITSLEGAPKKVGGYFECRECQSLKSLMGSPVIINDYFNCAGCESLVSLKGGPTEVKGNFKCGYCGNLKSLEGAPKNVEKSFSCSYCNALTSLKGAPAEVGGNFICNECASLTSLDGAPKKVGGNFNCMDCGKTFYKLSVMLKSRVKGHIYCKGNEDDIDPDTLARLGLKYDDI